MLSTILLQVAAGASLAKLGGAFGGALTALAAAFGLGKIGANAMEAIARQPEASGDIRTNLILSAALVESISLFSVIVSLLAVVTA